MSKLGKYIYGIIPRHCLGQINSNGEESFGLWGITALEGVYTIPYQNISAVVSDSEIVDYAHLLKDTVARYLLRHQQVIEKIMDAYTIVPMRLGTYALSKEDVEEILSKGHKEFKDMLKKAENKIEVDVVATWSDFSSLLKEVAEEEEIKEFKQSLLNKKEGVTIDDQIKIGAMIKNHLNEKREKYALEIQTSLNKVSESIKVHELMDDKMVANSAFLISKNKQKDFDKKVGGLNTKFAEKLYFRCVGPLPPYSFYTLEIKRINFKEVDWARKRLGLLNDTVTKKDIKRAHQAKAFSFHPDKNPNTPGIENEFDEVTRAFKILVDYCQACEQTGHSDNYSFIEEEFKKNAILVRVKE